MDYNELLDKLTDFYTSELYKDEVLEAKLDFFEKVMPSFDEDSEHFTLRMSQFLDWYLMTRQLKAVNETPVENALNESSVEINGDEREQLENISKFYHGLFEFVKIKKNDVYLKNLLTGKKQIIKNSNVTAGFHSEELFSVRLLPTDDSNFVFARGFCFHPTEAKKFIIKEAKKQKKAEEPEQQAFIMRLMQMRSKMDQYRHINLKHIYTNESSFKV